MTVWNAIKVNTLLYADGRLLRIIFAFIRFFKPKIKNMEDLDSQLLNLIFEKFDISNDTAEGGIESLMLATLRLERARVAFLALEPDADFVEVVSGLVMLAGIFDGANLDSEKRAELEDAVKKIIKSDTPEKTAAATEVFLGVLNAGENISDVNTYLDERIAPETEE
jgi:hypothetical protein